VNNVDLRHWSPHCDLRCWNIFCIVGDGSNLLAIQKNVARFVGSFAYVGGYLGLYEGCWRQIAINQFCLRLLCLNAFFSAQDLFQWTRSWEQAYLILKKIWRLLSILNPTNFWVFSRYTCSVFLDYLPVITCTGATAFQKCQWITCKPSVTCWGSKGGRGERCVPLHGHRMAQLSSYV
jgi:hypothetical protein